MPRAVSYLNSVAAEILAEQLPRLSIPNIKQRINNGQGYILLSDIRVSRYKRASVHTISTSAPNKLTWVMKNLNMGLIGDLSGEINIVVPVKLEGEAEVLARGVNFHLESALERSQTGAARVTTISCRTTIQTINIEIYNGGIAGLALNLFKVLKFDQNINGRFFWSAARSALRGIPSRTFRKRGNLCAVISKFQQAITGHIRPFIQALICKKITLFINEDLNNKLSQTQTKTSLADAVRTNTFGALLGLPDSAQLIESFRSFNINATYPFFNVTNYSALSARNVFFSRLSEDPVCYTDTVEIANLGEISIIGANKNTTPFDVPPMTWNTSSENSNAMIHLLISDYIANALLYHAFSEHLLQFIVDERTVSSLGPLLRTSCSSGICFADLIPKLAEQYPDNKVRLVFTPTRAPVVLFQAKQDGILTVNVNGLVFLYIVSANQTSQQAGAFSLDIVASTHLHIENNTLLGRTTMDSFQLQNKYGNMNISDDELSDIALLSSEMLQRSINDFLRAGFPIPIPKVMRIKATELRFLDRSVFVSTEFALDRRRVSVIALEAFADTRYFPRSTKIHSGSTGDMHE
ncbi:unnamed protein product [Gongylonema pulchrum]|uniref:BPI2 domain-containing protein n=1 Tax=Gongylonema pulchrum TaxID=637853 RepID=A0A3P7M184_9BILA|nr:unnamed protein product [Gongylonema pulchrum]